MKFVFKLKSAINVLFIGNFKSKIAWTDSNLYKNDYDSIINKSSSLGIYGSAA